MSTQFIAHTIYLVLATLLTYFWTSSPNLSTYTLQLIAALILTYFGLHIFTKNKRQTNDRTIITLDLIILTATILLIVTQTGGLSSAFFFTIYFLLFAVALLFEIEATLLLTGTLLVFFSLLPNTDLTLPVHITHLVSMLMITPLAIFTAHQYEQRLKEHESRVITESHLTQQETDSLIFISLNLKKTLISALDSLSIILPKTKLGNVRTDLTVLYQDLKSLYHSADELQQFIDQETDN